MEYRWLTDRHVVAMTVTSCVRVKRVWDEMTGGKKRVKETGQAEEKGKKEREGRARR